jgi:TPP-dependent pyruvate/acetoin dehydrogenase alpha subunit
MPGVAVDGNDVLAVYRATREAVDRARAGEGPTLIEAIPYRQEGHSSSDDPTRYRDAAEVAAWLARDPIKRFRNFLELEGLVTDALDAQIEAEVKATVNAAISVAEASPPPDVGTLFTDVYSRVPPHIATQRRSLLDESSDGTAEGAFPL